MVALLSSLNEPYANLVDDLAADVRDAGGECSSLVAETFVLGAEEVHDVYVMSNSERVWAIAGAMEARGSTVVNLRARKTAPDRLTLHYVLEAAGLAVPRSIAAANPNALLRVWPRDGFPAYLKSSASFGHSAVRLSSFGELADLVPVLPAANGWLLQVDVSADARWFKSTVVGGAIEVVEWSGREALGVVRHRDVEATSARVMEAVTADVASIDIVSTRSGECCVVDVNLFPIFRHSTNAWRDLVAALAERRLTSRPL